MSPSILRRPAGAAASTAPGTNVIPLLHRLDQIGPDLHHLLEVVADLRKLVARMPGMRRLGRVDEQGDEDPLPRT